MSFDKFWHGTLRRPYRLYSTKTVKDSKKPTIVLLHGIAASSADWQFFAPLLSQNYQVVTIDLLGFGKSPKPQWCQYRMEDHMRSINHTMNKLRLGKDYTLVGHSLGSLIASRYALDHGKHIKRLVLLSPPVYPKSELIKGKYSLRMTGLLLKTYKFLRTSNFITPRNFKKLAVFLPLPNGVITNPDTWIPFMRTLKECIEQQTIIDDVSLINIPTDVFYGRLDQVVIDNNVELLAKNQNITLHSFSGNHDLTKRYARIVSKVLTDD